ncbi:MAG: hypothetical protein KKE23_02295 [Nanoarchaeota archaeon]|nr:hypothetical protein [Nanoarchaeota archaeon]
MKRKIIKLGTATLVASLPAKWIREFGLKQGDYLEVNEKKGDLVLSTEKEMAKDETTIDITKFNTKLALYRLAGAYVAGYNKIEILHEQHIKEYTTGKNRKTSEFIQSMIGKFIGIEIIEQSEKKTVLKDLSGVSETDADNILRRAFLLTKWLAPECLEAIKKRNKEDLGEIENKARNVYKFLYFYRRLLNKKGYKDFSKTPIMYHNTYLIGDIARILHSLAHETAEFKKEYSKSALDIFAKVVVLIDKLDNLFFDFSNEKVLHIMNEREAIIKKIKEDRNKFSKEDGYLYANMDFVVKSVSHLEEGRFQLETN